MSNEQEYKHTPGPWMRADNQISPYSVQIVGNRVEYPRGEATVTAVALVLGNETSQHTTAANAALIAAAPDLLAACKELRIALAAAIAVCCKHGLAGQFNAEAERVGIRDRLGTRALAAIAAAEGEK